MSADAFKNALRVAHMLQASGKDYQSAVERARALAVDAAEFALVGDFGSTIEDYALAAIAYDQAVQRAPSAARYRFNRAAVLRFLGRLEEAEADLNRVIELEPKDSEAWLSRSSLREQTSERNHLRELEGRLAAGFQSWRGEVPIRFALAKEYEDLGDYERSWTHLAAGAALRRQHLQYDVRTDLQTVDGIMAAFPPGRAVTAGYADCEPIFIVGLPRTGTTLLERLLGGHPQVALAGELTDFALALVDAVRRDNPGRQLSRQELVAAAAGIDFAALGADYAARARRKVRGNGPFVDKMPLNYLYCGLIRRALPRARIIHMTRAPMATAYAIFKTLFNQGYPFSYDLGEIGAYYIGYRKLMAHWHRVMPGAILDVSYENLVLRPEESGQRVFAHCGLEWSSRYLDIRSVRAPSTTASAAQVRQAVHTGSVDRWRFFERHLEPFAERLRASEVDQFP